MLSTQYSFLPFPHSPSPVPQGLTVVAATFSFFHHPTAARLSSGTTVTTCCQCHACPHCSFSLHLCSSPPSGVVSVLAFLHYMQVLWTNSVFCSVSLKWFPAMVAMGFLHQHNQWGVQPLLWMVLHDFASVCAPNHLQSEAGLLVSSSITKLDVLCWRTTFETQESQLHKAREENQAYNICLYPETKTKHSSCATFLLVIYFKQQTSCLHNTRKPLEWVNCSAILSVDYCGVTTELRF